MAQQQTPVYADQHQRPVSGDDVPAHRALICVAAGRGERLGLDHPKALVPLDGKSILRHCLEQLDEGLGFEVIVVVAPPQPEARSAVEQEISAVQQRIGVTIESVPGGASRPSSVRAGFARLSQRAQELGWDLGQSSVLIQDAARPLTPAEVYQHVLAEIEGGAGAAIPAIAVADTIKDVETHAADETRSGNGNGTGNANGDATTYVRSTLPRAQLRAVQTPQGFSWTVLERALRYADTIDDAAAAALTDEAMLAESLGVAVHVVPGHERALKITTPIDLLTAGALARESSPPAHAGAAADQAVTADQGAVAEELPRTGIGHDIHAFAPTSEPRPLWLAGLMWPGQQGLAGHSDGDAVSHAACDALFSAAGIGDLGVHFGTDEPEFAGASGVALLTEAARRVREAGFVIGSISVQFVGNRPKFGPRRDEAQKVLSEAAGVPVALSATTSDGLGFTGRGEGIMATATATVRRTTV